MIMDKYKWHECVWRFPFSNDYRREGGLTDGESYYAYALLRVSKENRVTGHIMN